MVKKHEFKVEAKKFDISSVKGLKSAERYKAKLENAFDVVNVRTVGTDMILIEGYD
jgi:hypothetical protein